MIPAIPLSLRLQIHAAAIACLALPAAAVAILAGTSQGWCVLTGAAAWQTYHAISGWLFSRWERTQPTFVLIIKRRQLPHRTS